MRGDAEEHAVGEHASRCARATRGTARAPARRSRRPRGRRSRAGRSSPRRSPAAPEKLQSPIVVTPDRRHSCAPTVAIATMSSNVERRLALDVHPDPGDERQAVAEPGVHRVLDVRVRVDEAGRDHAALEVLAAPEIGSGTDRGDRPVVRDRDGSIGDRRALDGNDPVRRDALSRRRALRRSPSASCSASYALQDRRGRCASVAPSPWPARSRPRRGSAAGSPRTASETGSTVGSRIAKTIIRT